MPWNGHSILVFTSLGNILSGLNYCQLPRTGPAYELQFPHGLHLGEQFWFDPSPSLFRSLRHLPSA